MDIDLVDTHCHIHEADESFDGESETRVRWNRAELTPDMMIRSARDAGVRRLVCVGTTPEDSQLAVEFVQSRSNTWASIGIHPHETGRFVDKPEPLKQFAALVDKPKVVAIGECGLDYFYTHSSRADQEKILRFQIELALERDLPVIFHVREAFEGFWPIFDSYSGIRGVIHSFSAGRAELEQILQRNLYIGLNGIMTFTKDPEQLAAAKAAPLNRIVVETDAPFLTPAPHRGTICGPKHARVTAEFLADFRGESLDQFALATTQNARLLFGIAGKK